MIFFRGGRAILDFFFFQGMILSCTRLGEKPKWGWRYLGLGLEWTNNHQCTSWGWGRSSCFEDEPKTYSPSPKILGFSQPFLYSNFFPSFPHTSPYLPPTYLPPPTSHPPTSHLPPPSYLPPTSPLLPPSWFHVHSIAIAQEFVEGRAQVARTGAPQASAGGEQEDCKQVQEVSMSIGRKEWSCALAWSFEVLKVGPMRDLEWK
jgi:hypothetical protein